MKSNVVPPELAAIVKANFGDYQVFTKFMVAYGSKYSAGKVSKLVFYKQPSATQFFHSVASWAVAHEAVSMKQFKTLSACVLEPINLPSLLEWMSANAKNYLTPQCTAAEHVAAQFEKADDPPFKVDTVLGKAWAEGKVVAYPSTVTSGATSGVINISYQKYGEETGLNASDFKEFNSKGEVVNPVPLSKMPPELKKPNWGGSFGPAPGKVKKVWVPDVSLPAGGQWQPQYDGDSAPPLSSQAYEEFKKSLSEVDLPSAPPLSLQELAKSYTAYSAKPPKVDHFAPPAQGLSDAFINHLEESLVPPKEAVWKAEAALAKEKAAKAAEQVVLLGRARLQILNLLRYKASRDPLLDELGF